MFPLTGPLQLDNANRLWIEKSFPLHEEFLKTTSDFYRASADPTNFRGDVEGERVRINKWVEDQTKNKIKDLIPSGAVNAQTPLVLTNAIYFKANWARQFSKEKSYEGVSFFSLVSCLFLFLFLFSFLTKISSPKGVHPALRQKGDCLVHVRQVQAEAHPPGRL